MVAEVHLEVSGILCTVFVNVDASVKYALEFWVWSCKLKGVCMWLVSFWNAIKVLDVLRSYIYHAYWGLYHYSIESKTLKCFSCPHLRQLNVQSFLARLCALQSHITPAARSMLLNLVLQGFVLTSVFICNRYLIQILKLSRLKSYFFCVFCSWLVLCQLFVFTQPSSDEYNKANRKTH